MAIITISLPPSLKTYVDQQANASGYSSASDYVCELIRRDRDRAHLRRLLLEGTDSALTGVADADYFAALRGPICKRQSPKGQ